MKTFLKLLIIFGFMIAISFLSTDGYAQDAELERVQVFLTEQGYELGAADGFMGPRTKAALESFQRENGLNETGEIDPETLVLIQKQSQVEEKPAIEDEVRPEEIPDNSSSPLLWLLLGGLIAFLLMKIFGKKGRKLKPEKKIFTQKPKFKGQEKPTNRATSYVEKRNEDVLKKLRSGKAIQRLSTKKSTTHESENDELASFRIEFSSPSSKSSSADQNYSFSRFSSMGNRPTAAEVKSESNTCWVPKGKTVKISGIEISQGMIYVGAKLRSQRYGGVDNCLINPKLKVATNSNSYDSDSIGYWPSYEGLNPKARREYLKWLANGAKDPDANISFAFLYFYCLERRLFLDKSIDEAEAILSEMKRLQAVYPDNHSLERYVENALSFAAIFNPKSTTAPILEMPKKPNWQIPMNIALYLGNKLKAGEALNNDDALLWFLNHPEKHLRTPAKRLESEFIALLKIKLAKAQPNGPKVRMPKGKLNPEYSSCSSTFSVKFTKYTKGIPDIRNMKAPVNAVQKLADEAMNELDKLSRLLGRNPNARGSFKALSLMPPQIISNYGGKKFDAVKTWISERVEKKSGVFTFEEIISRTTDFDGKKVTKSIHKDVDLLLMSLGWSMIPKPYETIGSMKPKTKLLVTPSSGDIITDYKPSEAYHLAFLEVSLGAYIAHADDRLLEVEVSVLIEKVKKLTHLTTKERSRLYEVVKWLSVQVTDFGAINRKIKSVSKEQKNTFVELAIAVAVADGKIDPGEVRALETIYQTLGFDKKDLYSGLHSLGASKPQYDKSASDRQSPSTVFDAPDEGLGLDMERVQSTLVDTKKASALLASIFEDEESDVSEETIIEKDDESDSDANNKFEGLDTIHAQFLAELLERTTWSKEDYVRLASSLNLLADGAMEVINEWAFEKYDEPIVEDGEPIEVYSELLGEA